jgi:hypothetical protein
MDPVKDDTFVIASRSSVDLVENLAIVSFLCFSFYLAWVPRARMLVLRCRNRMGGTKNARHDVIVFERMNLFRLSPPVHCNLQHY